MALVPGNLVRLLVNMQVLNGAVAPVFLVFVLLLANRHTVLGEAANGRRFRLVAAACVAGVAAMAILFLAQTIAGSLGVM
ncbi:MAG: divalent metal cation transporter [Actinobacteria bacterium]|nr:divalent metal cation transporter [Actinomycetota bacterium]